MLVRNWMQTDLITLQSDDSLDVAKTLMKTRKIRRIPIIDEKGRLKGIISQEDIKKALPAEVDATLDSKARALANQLEISAFMTPEPITATPDDTMESVASLMRTYKIGGIPVVEGELLAGIITESDIYDAFVEALGGKNRDTRIELTINRGSDAIYKLFEVLSVFGTPLNNVVICNSYSSKRKAVILRIDGGKREEEVIEALWECGCQINSISSGTGKKQ